MQILVLGGTGFLSGATVREAVARGHRVVAVTRGRRGEPPAGAVSVHADRDVTDQLADAVGSLRPEAVVDVCGYTVAGAGAAAAAFADVPRYVYVSSISAYRGWPPGPVRGESDPTFGPDADLAEYGPMKAESERVLGAVFGERLCTVRAGLIVGPRDRTRRLTSWLHRIATEARVVVPADLDQPVAFVDVRDLAAFLVDAAERGVAGAVNATGPVGMTTYGGMLRACQAAVRTQGGVPAELVPVPEDELLTAGVEPWSDLPFWLPSATASTAWQVDTSRARELGLATRPIEDSVLDTWRWVQETGLEHPARPRADAEARLLARH